MLQNRMRFPLQGWENALQELQTAFILGNLTFASLACKEQLELATAVLILQIHAV